MKRVLLAAALVLTPPGVHAQSETSVIRSVVEKHILPGFSELSAGADRLSQVAARDCEPTSPVLRSAYGHAFDAWISVSHLRFGPTEVHDRAFALAFWPGSRGATPKSLRALILAEDPIVSSATSFAQVSIAARGFYALEFLLFDEEFISLGDPAYRCKLIRTMTEDIAAVARGISDDWQSSYAGIIAAPSPDGIYRSREEVLQEFFKALSAGLQFTSETRLGRPLGTFERPRPMRAEVRRSGRSVSHMVLSLSALGELADHLSAPDAALSGKVDQSFNRALTQLENLNDPAFATVTDPQGRIRIEVIQQSVDAIRAVVRNDIGPTLGVAAGFNSLDGD
ncbi:imelysin family protein [Roseobacter sp. S98]|uniref:imelysin family protein n=1 Tax=Roseobacter algicola (ex Choi et al. 2025) (nom. illeg.) TaxID=3092138 RepID=UPI0035C6BE69